MNSNNEAEYAALRLGLELFLEYGIKRVVIKGDSLLVVRKIKGIWACKSESLMGELKQIQQLIKNFEIAPIQHMSYISLESLTKKQIP